MTNVFTKGRRLRRVKTSCEEKRVNEKLVKMKKIDHLKKKFRAGKISHDIFHTLISHDVHGMLSQDVEARRRRPIIIIISFVSS